MSGRSFAPIGSSGEWPRFANGKRYPYTLWGGTFRDASERVIGDDSNKARAVSVIAIGQIEHSEIALLTFGEEIEPSERAAEFGDEAKRLLASTPETSGWAEEFEGPFEDFKKLSRQENSGLLVVTHGVGVESAPFGNIANSVSSHALTAMGDMLLSGSGVRTAQQDQAAAS